MIPLFVHDDLAALEFSLQPHQLEQLDAFLLRVLEANKVMNLTAIQEPDEAWRRMIVDSLTVTPGMPEASQGVIPRVIDVGTGAGFPGVPLAIACPQVSFTLVETTGKKARFIQEAVAAIGLKNVAVINDRAEKIGHDAAHRAAYDVGICRAVGVLSVVLEYLMPLVKVNGRALAMKGPRAQEELEAASDALAVLGAGDVAVIEAYPESFANELVIVSVFKDRPTPRKYPREPGLPARQPL
jgi:16S rRNA (guanine527-N7)-methyltransferase